MLFPKLIQCTLFAFLCIFVLTACNDSIEHDVNKILILGGNNQNAFCGENYAKDLTVRVVGPTRPGILGGTGNAASTFGAKVAFKVDPHSDLKLISDSVITTSYDGIAKFKVQAGTQLGDQYATITATGAGQKPISIPIRFVSGIVSNWDVQEGNAGYPLGKDLEIVVRDSAGNPISNVPIKFQSFVKGKSGPEIKVIQNETDRDGHVACAIKLGPQTRSYRIGYEIHAPDKNIQLSSRSVEAMSFNTVALLISVIAGLAIFVFGMKIMSDGLNLVAGDKMRKVLGYLTHNRVLGVIAGAVLTAIMQSSSATTVMVVGFVNAGLLNLMQSISVIFGANIGSTMTAQIISFKLDVLALPAIIVGIVFLLLVKKSYLQGWGNTILGFGLLFYGMGMMSSELKVVGDFPSFVKFFEAFDCTPLTEGGPMPVMNVLGAIAIGTLMTVLVQSSAATIGIAMALATSGLLSFWTAIPLILGDNIGTTITAVLASLGSNRQARQTALAHVLFNVLGVFWVFMLFFINWPGTHYPIAMYVINSVTAGNGFAGENIAHHLANGHTLFNVTNVLVLLPFMGYIAWMVNKFLPISETEKSSYNYLDSHLLDTPPVAINQVIRSIRYMTKESSAMISSAIENCFIQARWDPDINAELQEREDKVDRIQHEVTSYLVQLTYKHLTDNQRAMIPLLVHCTNNAERIADQAELIMTQSKRLSENGSSFSPDTVKELEEIMLILKRQFNTVVGILDQVDGFTYQTLAKEEGTIDKLRERLESLHILKLSKREEDPTAGVIMIELIAELERTSDRLSNIGERIGKVNKLLSKPS